MRKFITFISLLGALTLPAALPATASAASVQCECVRYLREVLGVNIKGDAWTISPNIPTTNAQVGDVVLLQYGNVSHAALITSVNDEVHYEGSYYRVVKGFGIKESNFERCTPTQRTIGMANVKGIYRPFPILSTPYPQFS